MKVIDGAIVIPQVYIYCPKSHPAYIYWVDYCDTHYFDLVDDLSKLDKAEYLFLISCTQKLSKEQVSKFDTCCVIHESDLPEGRGWSPLAWQIIEGKNEIKISAIECADEIDSGDILAQRTLILDGGELSNEIHFKAFLVKSDLVLDVINRPNRRKQVGEPSYYQRREPWMSRISPLMSISKQFDLMRVCDERFPVFFEYRGYTYELTLKKVNVRCRKGVRSP